MNLTALLRRLVRICFRRVGSPTTRRRAAASISATRASALPRARGPNRARVSSTRAPRSNGWASISMRPASSRLKSRISARIWFRAPAELTIVPTSSRCIGSRLAPRSTSARPRTPFRGVRISWLILARNSLLARLAASARRTAASSSSAWRFMSVISMRRPITPPSAVRRSSISSQRPSAMRCSWRRPGLCSMASRRASHSASRPTASG